MSDPDLDFIQESPISPVEENYPPLQAEEDNLQKEQALIRSRISTIKYEALLEDLNRTKVENNQRVFVQQNVWDLMKAWLACVLLLTLFSGIERGIPLCQRTGAELTCQTFLIHYEKEVLIALISSPTVAIVGLAVIVLKYLFPSKDGK